MRGWDTLRGEHREPHGVAAVRSHVDPAGTAAPRLEQVWVLAAVEKLYQDCSDASCSRRYASDPVNSARSLAKSQGRLPP